MPTIFRLFPRNQRLGYHSLIRSPTVGSAAACPIGSSIVTQGQPNNSLLAATIHTTIPTILKSQKPAEENMRPQQSHQYWTKPWQSCVIPSCSLLVRSLSTFGGGGGGRDKRYGKEGANQGSGRQQQQRTATKPQEPSDTSGGRPLMNFNEDDLRKQNDSYWGPSGGNDDDDDDDDEYPTSPGIVDPRTEKYKEMLRQKAIQRKEFENRKGRGWSDPLDMEPFFEANPQLEDEPEWDPSFVHPIIKERLHLLPQGIPTLHELARLPLPPPSHINPEQGNLKAYNIWKRKHFIERLSKDVRAMAGPQVERIQAMATWEEKQEAVDVLFEQVEAKLKKEQVVLGRHPDFGDWIETALEAFLVEVDETSKRSLYSQVMDKVRAVAQPKIEILKTLNSLEERQQVAKELFASVLSLHTTPQAGNTKGTSDMESGAVSKHPLFQQWVGKALEEYVHEIKDKGEGDMLERISDLLSSQVADRLREIQKLSGDDRVSALAELCMTAKDDYLKDERFEAASYHFGKWLRKTHEDFLYQQVSDMVKTATQQFDTVHDQDAQQRLIQLRSKILKQQLEQDNFPLSKHESFVGWVKRALEEYLENSQEYLFQKVQSAVVPKAEVHIERIRVLEPMEDRWAAVDELAKSIQDELVSEKFDLAGHYQISKWVKKAIKNHFIPAKALPAGNEMYLQENTVAPLNLVKRAIDQQLQELEAPDPSLPTVEQDAEAMPVFMDVYGPGCTHEQNVPDILRPLKWYPRSKCQGRMMEEWDLAAHKETKRIMLRQSTRDIAQLVEKGETDPQRIFVHGKQGVGKTAALAAIVASARKSGHIVYFMPDSRMLSEHGYYNVPNKTREGIFDLPMLSQEQCKVLMETCGEAIEGMTVDREHMSKFFTEKRMEKMKDEMTLVEILELAADAEPAAAACFSCVMEALMIQEEKPFTIVVDEVNVFYTIGKYYNMLYDPEVKHWIPYPKLNLFQHILEALAISVEDDGELVLKPRLMKKGSIVAATSENHCVPRKVTNLMLENAQRSISEVPEAPVKIVELPRLSKLESDHMLFNYEAVGMCGLRFDNGAIAQNPSELEYFRVVSGANPQKLMNVCVFPFP